MPEPLTVFQRLHDRLSAAQVEFGVLHHAPVYTSAEAATVRGVPLSSGAKALICKLDDHFVMFVMPADRRLANRLVRQTLGTRKLRFATREEVAAMTGLAPGSIPPFGSLFELPTYCDLELTRQPRINFNAGDHAISVSMSVDDYLRTETPQVGLFAEPADSATS